MLRVGSWGCQKKGERDDLNLEDKIGRHNLRELRNRNPKFGRFNRPNLFYPIYVDRDRVDSNGCSPISLKRDGAFDHEVLPLNSEGGESCWRWKQDLVAKNLDPDTLKSNVVAKAKTNGDFGIYEKYRKTTYKAKSIWDETDVITEQGTIELRSLGLGGVFDFPKPLGLLKKICLLSCGPNDLVLDFTAGSATTANAVLDLNREDRGQRRFIMIQLQEPITDKTETGRKALELGFKTVSDIGEERIRRVITKLANEVAESENPTTDAQPPEDLGFRVFELRESNFRQWSGLEGDDGDEYADEMELFTDPLLPGWELHDVLWEIIIKEGLDLSVNVEELDDIASNRVWRVGNPNAGRSFLICLDDEISAETQKTLNLRQDDFFVCRDSALTDEQAANLALQCNFRTV